MAIEQIKQIAFTGHSFYVVVPKSYIHALGMKRRDQVVVRLTQNHIELIPYERNEQCKRT